MLPTLLPTYKTKQRTRKLIKEIVRELNAGNSELWSILSALRGPDSDAARLKFLTTERIRAVIGLRRVSGDEDRPRFVAKVNLDPLSMEEGRERRNVLTEGHFRRHYMQACDAIQKIYGYDLIQEQFPYTDAPTGFDIPNRNAVRGPRPKQRKA